MQPSPLAAAPGGFGRRHCHHLLLRCVVVLLLFCTSAAALDPRQREALSQLYEDFRRPAALSSWTATGAAPCATWIGVTCDSTTASVISLSLPHLQSFPAGSRISPAISSLLHLQSIDLSGNSISGPLPPDISLLRSLTSLNLSYNNLSGSLPASPWRNLTHLRFLHLHGNLFAGSLPPELAFSSSLQSLRLERNKFTGPIPSDILSNRLPSLRYFAVEHNSLNGTLPQTVGAAFRLRSLYLSHNQFSGTLPSALSNLTKLHNFAADGNRLSGPLPPSFATRRFVTFNVSFNNFSGPIPLSSINNWTASSFLGNPFLCGVPLPNVCTDVGPRPAAIPSPSEGTKSTPAQDTDRHHSASKLVAAVVGGFCVASAVLLVLLLVLHRRRRRRREVSDAAVVPESLNWFSSENQARRMQSRWEVFRRSFNGHTYEEMVAGAGHFDTAHVLGKGRFSTVYRSELIEGGDAVVAIKVFKHYDVPANFERELDLLALLKHKNLLCVRGFYTNPLEKAILLDYMPAGTLYQLLHGGGGTTAAAAADLDWSSRHKIAMGVAQAMVYLHARRVLHRDLKSTNVLLQDDLTPQVADFGLVHLICGRRTAGGGGGASIDAAAVVVTPSYTAPEVAASKRYTDKSDVYSYGVVLLELITGRKAEGVVEWARGREKKGGGAAEVADPAAIRSCVWPECIEKAVELALRCVEDKAEGRPSMAAVVSVLETLLPILSPLRSPSGGISGVEAR